MLVSDSIVSIGYKLKQTRPDYHLYEIEFPAYTPDNELCPVSVVQEYLAWNLSMGISRACSLVL